MTEARPGRLRPSLVTGAPTTRSTPSPLSNDREEGRARADRDVAAVPPTGPEPLGSVLGALKLGSGVARLGAGASWKVAEWYLRGSVEVSRRLVQGAMEGESAPQLVGEVVDEWRERVRELLGIDELADLAFAPRPAHNDDVDEVTLRARGAELLRRSADVTYVEPFHPAYGRILELLAPDEARVLRLLYLDGAQPTVDVRTGTTLPGSSELLASGLSMIAASAGCRFHDRVPAYLNNLFRLGLVWFSREPMADLQRYQVLEAQPEVLEALSRTKRARTVRRSLHLTPFGADFCRICIPTEAVEPPADR